MATSLLRFFLASALCILPTIILTSDEKSAIKITTEQAKNIYNKNLFSQRSETQKTDWSKFLARTTTSLSIASVGILTGGICAYMEKSFYTLKFPLSWMFLYGLREIIVQGISRDMQESRIPHNPVLAASLARLADWLTYFGIKIFC
jgi:hypothetical protein